ncbi:MAG: sigma-70 family RNA polymerase sigma factor [Acidobacteria bacterium]|nr:sigma-70 family RNA polymerase sigma factor [Acidobacteriota bacterium]
MAATEPDANPPHEVTRLLARWRRGDSDAESQLFEIVHAELRQRALRQMRRERAAHTLQPTALVNEAYVKLVAQDRVNWQSRAQFFSIASRVMRRILIDHGRVRKAGRRGGGSMAVTLTETAASVEPGDVDLVQLGEALEKLGELDSFQAELVDLRYFAGFSIADTARILGVHPSRVKRHWRVARAWLFRELRPEGAKNLRTP